MDLFQIKELLELCNKHNVSKIEVEGIKIVFEKVYEEGEQPKIPTGFSMPTDDQLLGLEPMTRGY